MTFTFVYQGKIRRDADPTQVTEGLARLFQVSNEDVAGLLAGQACFERRGLNEFTAKSYQKLFEQVGAIGFVLDERQEVATPGPAQPAPVVTAAQKPVEPLATVSDSESGHCPKCHSANIDAEQCFDCGIYLAKFRAAASVGNSNADATLENQSGGDNFDDGELAQRAGFWLKVATIGLLVLFIADSYLQKIVTPTISGIDLGYWPYLFGHLLLLRACFVYAEYKGYSRWLGLLGLLSLAGLAVLVLLKHKQLEERDSRAVLIEWVSAAFCFGITIYAFVGLNQKFEATSQLEEHASALRSGRQEYPSESADADSEIYAAEEAEMKAFLNDSFAIISRHNFRPDEISSVVEQLFAELSRYEVWRKYQIHLHYQLNQALPFALQREQIKLHDESFARLMPKDNQEEFHPRLLALKTDWLVGQRPEEGPPIWLNLYRHMENSFDLIRIDFQNQMFSQAEEPNRVPVIDLQKLPISTNQQFSVAVDANTITYTAPIGPLAEYPVVVAFYLVPYQRRLLGGEKTLYELRTAVISPGFPNKYLYGMFNVLRDYIIIPE